jgi:hypothetical protein
MTAYPATQERGVDVLPRTCSQDGFYKEPDEALKEFFDSGETHVAKIFTTIVKIFDSDFAPKNALQSTDKNWWSCMIYFRKT